MPLNSTRYINTEFNPLNRPPTKICVKCKNEKKREEFKTKHSTKDGKDTMCTPCRDETNRERGRKQKKRKEEDRYNIF
jgi:hypothetical protein